MQKAKPKKLQPQSESTIQENIVELLSRLAPGRFLFFSIPNAQFISYLPKNVKYKMIAKLKRMGMLPGVADLCVISEGEAFFIEVKTATGKMSENQKLFLKACHDVGAPYALATSAQDVQILLDHWKII